MSVRENVIQRFDYFLLFYDRTESKSDYFLAIVFDIEKVSKVDYFHTAEGKYMHV